MRLRLTDFKSNTREGVEGTCERCMRTVMLNYPTYTFADSGGGVHVVEGWYSDWGDHIVLDVHLPLFTHWLHGAEFKRPKDVAELSNIDGLSGERLWEEYYSRSSNRRPTATPSRNSTKTSPGRSWAVSPRTSRQTRTATRHGK